MLFVKENYVKRDFSYLMLFSASRSTFKMLVFQTTSYSTMITYYWLVFYWL